MIVAFEGTPGSGKTYDAVREICNNLKLGRRVYTNVEGMELPECQRFLQDFCNLDDYQFKSLFYWLPDSDMCHFWDLTKLTEMNGVEHKSRLVQDGSLIVIDEIHKLFSTRDWNSDLNKHFSDWASTHRHYGYDCYFITQSLSKIDKRLHSVIEWTYVYKKVNFLGRLSKNRYIKYAYSGDDTRSKPLNTISRLYALNVFRCYKSMVNDTNVKLNIMPQVNILKHPVFFFIPLLLCLFLYMFFSKSSFATGDLFGTSKIAHKHEKPVAVPAAPAGSVMPFPASASASASVSVPVSPPLPSPGPSVVVPPGSVPLGAVPAFDGSRAVFVRGVIDSGQIRRYLLSDGRIVPSKTVYTVDSQFKE